MIPGLLTDPACPGDMQARADAHADAEAFAEATDADRIARAYAWQNRDLDRRLTKDSDEVTTW